MKTKYSTLQAGESLKGVSLFFARLCLRVGLLGFLRKAIKLFLSFSFGSTLLTSDRTFPADSCLTDMKEFGWRFGFIFNLLLNILTRAM